MSENIKPFDHKPDKYGIDGRIIRRDSHSRHVVNGEIFYNFPIGSDKFYTEGGVHIPLEQVPDVCKKHLGKPVDIKKVQGSIQSKKSGSEPKASDSLV